MKIRAYGERAISAFTAWKILVKLRCCSGRATAIVQAILVLHHLLSQPLPRTKSINACRAARQQIPRNTQGADRPGASDGGWESSGGP